MDLTFGKEELAFQQEVRDWLGGQSWFDTRQYRILPPEGISIHWSRYVDLGIAAFLVPASWVLPPTQAELAAIMLWPTLLGCYSQTSRPESSTRQPASKCSLRCVGFTRNAARRC